MGRLEHPLGDAERDPVDEEAAPRARASPAAPPAGAGSRSGSAGTPPSAPPRASPSRERRRHSLRWVSAPSTIAAFTNAATAEPQQDDVAPARVHGAPAVRPRRREAPPSATNRTRATTSGTAPREMNHLRCRPRCRRCLERREAGAHRGAVAPRSARGSARAARCPRLDDPSTTSATSRSQAVSGRRASPAASSRSATLSCAQAGPGGPFGRHRRRRVHTAADQVEERRGELERARPRRPGAAASDERRLRVRRRLLLVLAVVAGRSSRP